MSARSGAVAAPEGALRVLDEWHRQGLLADIDRHFGRFVVESDARGGPEVALAGALASARALAGHTCLSLREVAGRDWPPDEAGAAAVRARGAGASAAATRLPELDPWMRALAASPVVARPGDPERRPLVLDHRGRLYLDRFWRAERTVAASLRRLADAAPADPPPDEAALEAALARLFPDAAPDDRARQAVRAAVCRRLCVVAGGPGTGKTTTAAAVVALLVDLGLAAPGRIALAAPTGKAAARLQEAVRGWLAARAPSAPAEVLAMQASTVHRLLLQAQGGADGGGAAGKLPVDTLLLDEGSMVDLSLMARVLSALPERARLVVLGDSSQLASVEPGSVFADLCQAGRSPSSPLAPCVVELVRNWRFDDTGGIGRLAAAVVRGDPEGALAALEDPSDDATSLHPLPDPGAFHRLAVELADERFAPALRAARALHAPVEDGFAPLRAFRVLCAHRTGPFGAGRFNQLVERRLRALGLVDPGNAFYPGRPVLVTRNDPRTGLSNGDTGVVLRAPGGEAAVWFPELRDAAGGPRLVSPARLPPHESFFALTVHRAQGSEYGEVAVVPGPAGSRVLTRELLYTAVTRARERVVVYGERTGVADAVERETARWSGLRDALEEPREEPGPSAA